MAPDDGPERHAVVRALTESSWLLEHLLARYGHHFTPDAREDTQAVITANVEAIRRVCGGRPVVER